MADSNDVRRAKQALTVLRGEATFFTSDERAAEIINQSFTMLFDLVEGGRISPDDVGSSWDELRKLLWRYND